MTPFQLSREQIVAVQSNSSAIVLVASAGTGKTEVVAHRIERLLKESGDENYRVLAVSYTVKAADELRNRLASRLGDLHRRVDADTIHGFALALLRQYGTSIGLPPEPEVLTRDADRVEIFDSWLRESGESVPTNLSATLRELDIARARCEDAPLLEEWRAALSTLQALDYPAMLDCAYELTSGSWLAKNLRRIYQHVIVDEAQNLTRAQYRLLTQVIGEPIVGHHLSAMLVGDEHQSIVGFAGGDSSLISRFAHDYQAERIELHVNFRSAREIVNAERSVARALGRHVGDQADIEYAARGSVAVHTCDSERAEAEHVGTWVTQLISEGLPGRAISSGEQRTVEPSEIAVLARAAASLRPVRDFLERQDTPVASASTEDDWMASLAGKTLVELVALRAAPGHFSTRRRLAALCGSDDPDWRDIRSLLNAATETSVAKLAELDLSGDLVSFLSTAQELEIDDPDWADDLALIDETWLSFLDHGSVQDATFGSFRQYIARCQRGDNLSPGVRLLTVHKAQGREFKAVAVIACNEGQFPDFRASNHQQQQSELRTFYVAISRASRVLLLTRSTRRQTRYGGRRTDPSRFLRLIELPAES